MRLRHKKNAEVDVNKSPYCINVNDSKDIVKGKTYLELGMGKGRFIIEMAKRNPKIDFIGIEKSATIVLKAIDNLKKYESDDLQNHDFETNDEKSLPEITKGRRIDNVRFMCVSIENIDNIFKPSSIDKIYLNFSDPWPKKRHEIRRLTHRNFLNKYETILKEKATIEFKTDNVDLFDFSLEEIKQSNFKLLSLSYDLHNDPILSIDNVMTEYEEKFSKLGNRICKLIAEKN